ncbi:helix-turn-helix transcriptional regulator [Leeia sp.]|uniref:helix-turn-helix transcriptional regulator n=1 Tax=Leeia sp. TaxID=2884678 RepID=UPI0035ADD3C2
MRRADRLMQILLLLRGRRCTTAQQLAEWLEVSDRTIYRDIRDLMSSGAPIDGEAGVGYRLRKGFELPPLLFTPDEVRALHLGARMVAGWADREARQAAQAAMTKLETTLPTALVQMLQANPSYVAGQRPYPLERLAPVREAILQRHKLLLSYVREDGLLTERVVWPLGLFFWGDRWTLAAWCELRQAMRHFRIDRLQQWRVLEEGYPLQEGRTLQDYLRSLREDHARLIADHEQVRH